MRHRDYVANREARDAEFRLARKGLRFATIKDATLLYGFRNAADMVEMSTTRRRVSWDEHCAWLQRRLSLGDALIFILDDDAGMVRFDRKGKGDTAEVSIYVVPEHRNEGLAVAAVEKGVEVVRKTWPSLTVVEATIRVENVASHKTFLKAGFQFVSHNNEFLLLRRDLKR